MSKLYTLYGAKMSLYTGKTRAYLQYKQIPFKEVFSTLNVYKKIIVPNTGVKFIPVVLTPEGDYLQDTTVIMEQLEVKFPARSIVPPGPVQQFISEVFHIWADEWLLIPAMHYRWNHDNSPFIYQEFGRVVSPNIPAFIRGFVGKKVAARFKGFVSVLGITPKSIPAIENWYERQVLVELDRHFAQHDYLLGDRPCAGDFGLIGPLYAHLYRDPAPGRIMRAKAPNLVKWVERMNTAALSDADWSDKDEIPTTLIPLLKNIFAEFWPVLLNTLARTQQWIKDNPEQKALPRSIGEHQFTIGKVSEMRVVLTFHQWKLQRVYDLYNRFSDDQQAQVQNLLQQQCDYQLSPLPIEKRVTRENNRLVVA
jgi:glutathione S-transferase